MKKMLLLAAVTLLLFAFPVFASAAEEGGEAAGGFGLNALAAAFAIGVAAFGGALGQAKAIASACEGMARNPGAAGPIRIALLLGLAFIESLVIYALVIAFVIPKG